MFKPLTLLILVFPLVSHAQFIPNADFENWEFNGWDSSPTGWMTGNTQLTQEVFQDTDAYSGEYAMRVEAIAAPLGQYGQARTSFPITFIPASLNFAVKSLVEFGAVEVRMTFFNNGAEVTSYSWFSSENFPEWTIISLPMIQIEPVITDAEITVAALVGDLVAGTAEITIDSLYFNFVLSEHNHSQLSSKIFPNPTNGDLRFEAAERIREVSIYNLSGQRLAVYPEFQSTGILSLEIFDTGVYFIELLGESGSRSMEKVVVLR